MKRIFTILLAIWLSCGLAASGLASDWDVAGKVLTGIEGLRILSGGRVDIIGNITGVGREEKSSQYPVPPRYTRYRERNQRVWVPHYVWEKKWVPEHTEYDKKYGEVLVDGHYIRYKVQDGGEWAYNYSH